MNQSIFLSRVPSSTTMKTKYGGAENKYLHTLKMSLVDISARVRLLLWKDCHSDLKHKLSHYMVKMHNRFLS